MSSDRPPQPPPIEQSGAEAVAGNVPWVDPYTDDVLARMRAQGPLSATVDELRSLAGGAFIGSTIDTTSNSVTVYWYGPRPAAVNSVVSQAVAAGITVNIIDAPFSAAELDQSRSRISYRMRELGISLVRFDVDGRGSTVHFRTAEGLRAAKDALADYETREDHVAADTDEVPPAIAVLHSPPGSPAIRISDQLRNPQSWAQ